MHELLPPEYGPKSGQETYTGVDSCDASPDIVVQDEPIFELGPRRALLIGNEYTQETHLRERLPRLWTPSAGVDELERVLSDSKLGFRHKAQGP